MTDTEFDLAFSRRRLLAAASIGGGAVHDGAEPEFGTFRTAPRGRAAFTFTSFGDRGTPTLGRAGAAGGPAFVNDNLGSPSAEPHARRTSRSSTRHAAG